MLFISLKFIYFALYNFNPIEYHEKNYCSDIRSPVNCHVYCLLQLKLKMRCIWRRQAKVSNRTALTDFRRKIFLKEGKLVSSSLLSFFFLPLLSDSICYPCESLALRSFFACWVLSAFHAMPKKKPRHSAIHSTMCCWNNSGAWEFTSTAMDGA